mmetsp:Transcript_30381/g.51177  ORF Transcript_30381/g.51177 Transcript_30381/m.51177 type:complete len:202 (-) Transcript_30381:87-692(-)
MMCTTPGPTRRLVATVAMPSTLRSWPWDGVMCSWRPLMDFILRPWGGTSMLMTVPGRMWSASRSVRCSFTLSSWKFPFVSLLKCLNAALEGAKKVNGPPSRILSRRTPTAAGTSLFTRSYTAGSATGNWLRLVVYRTKMYNTNTTNTSAAAESRDFCSMDACLRFMLSRQHIPRLGTTVWTWFGFQHVVIVKIFLSRSRSI